MTRPLTPPSLVKCDDCDGKGRIETIRCIHARPMSRCDGDCGPCRSEEDCPTCKGSGEVIDTACLCPICLENVPPEEAAVTGGAICEECAEWAEPSASPLLNLANVVLLCVYAAGTGASLAFYWSN